MKYLCALALAIFTLPAGAQDKAFGKRIVDTLTTPYFWGRGYTKDGMKKAAVFIAEQFKTLGLQPMKGDDYYQPFIYPVNRFPGKMELSLNGKKLQPGKDFIVAPNSKGVKAKGSLVEVESGQYINREHKLIIAMTDTLIWSASPDAADFTAIEVRKRALDWAPGSFEVNMENEVVKKFLANNVCAMVPGTDKPDSVILITAHYDHLGGMGDATYFPGANDNASGIALLLNLARYYAKNPQRYTIGFICFAGEEIGLVGSEYYVKHPLQPLKNIRFMLNTDLAGNGDDGITIVNATEFPKEFGLMNEINNSMHLFKNIYSRGKAKNSDHYHFTEKGVPAFFFYTQGGIAAYHDVWDKAETLPLNEHEDLFKLVVHFNQRLMNVRTPGN